MNARAVLSIILSSVVVVVLSGCASPATKEAMVAQNVQFTTKHDRTVSVRTAGGAETTAMDSSNISDADFKAAIEESITKTKVFKSVIQGKGADYDLAVSIVQLEKPAFGFTFTVNMEAAWVLVKQSDRSVMLKKSIKSSHSATFGDAAAGVTRLRLAVEGAAVKNIEQGLQEIAALSL
jgi:ABC-type uncharacterized transport system auxiliary subunit